MKINASRWKEMKIYEKLSESMEFDGNRWKLMEINWNPNDIKHPSDLGKWASKMVLGFPSDAIWGLGFASSRLDCCLSRFRVRRFPSCLRDRSHRSRLLRMVAMPPVEWTGITCWITNRWKEIEVRRTSSKRDSKDGAGPGALAPSWFRRDSRLITQLGTAPVCSRFMGSPLPVI